MTKVQIFTDGAARGNPDGPGGYGTILQFTDSQGVLHEKEMSGGFVRTTNNRMELLAAITGLEALNRPCQVDLYSDSKYLTDAFNQHWIDNWVKNNWKRGKSGPVKNIDLWERLLRAKARDFFSKKACVSPAARPARIHAPARVRSRAAVS